MPIPEQSDPIEGVLGSLSDAVFDRLVGLILDGTLDQGERLRDKEIAEWLGVSRTPVRVAIGRLVQTRMVESEPSRYTRVTRVSDDTVEKTLEFTGYMAGICMRMALRRMDERQLSQAVALLDSTMEVLEVDEAKTMYVRSRAFYKYLASSTENPLFVDVMRQTGLAAEWNLRNRRPQHGTLEERDRWFRTLREAMLVRDLDSAERVIRRQHGL